MEIQDISYHEIFWRSYVGFHPESDGSSYRANRLVESLARSEICVSRHVPSLVVYRLLGFELRLLLDREGAAKP